MNLKKLSKVYHTLKHLKFKQVYFQVYYRLRKKISRSDFSKPLKGPVFPVQLVNHIPSGKSFEAPGQFTFLNLGHTFSGKIDWNYSAFGKLWTYNLNYFDFLEQPGMTKEQGLALIEDYIANDALLKDGKEPYPISLRGINWIRFLSKHDIRDAKIDQALYNHYQNLLHNIEYHLLGNHLLENGFSLLFAAYYFRNTGFLKCADAILRAELKEQTLKDGAHFELAPMYHVIILFRLLDCLNLQQNNSWEADRTRSVVKETSEKMLGWLEAIVYQNGDIPMLNDSAYGITPASEEIFDYAKRLGLKWQKSQLLDSGYRKWSDDVSEMIMDVGHIGPDYIPGHAHSDTFNFELRVKGNPFIVDQGISTYEKNARRQQERSTDAHNTVMVNRINQSNVWGGFRVAQRARIVQLEEKPDQIIASHDGYKTLNIIHQRTFSREEGIISISDELKNAKPGTDAKAYLHFHPDIKEINLNGSTISFPENQFSVSFVNSSGIRIFKYEFCEGYNKTAEANAVEISFHDRLSTQINL